MLSLVLSLQSVENYVHQWIFHSTGPNTKRGRVSTANILLGSIKSGAPELPFPSKLLSSVAQQLKLTTTQCWLLRQRVFFLKKTFLLIPSGQEETNVRLNICVHLGEAVTASLTAAWKLLRECRIMGFKKIFDFLNADMLLGYYQNTKWHVFIYLTGLVASIRVNPNYLSDSEEGASRNLNLCIKLLKEEKFKGLNCSAL